MSTLIALLPARGPRAPHAPWRDRDAGSPARCPRSARAAPRPRTWTVPGRREALRPPAAARAGRAPRRGSPWRPGRRRACCSTRSVNGVGGSDHAPRRRSATPRPSAPTSVGSTGTWRRSRLPAVRARLTRILNSQVLNDRAPLEAVHALHAPRARCPGRRPRRRRRCRRGTWRPGRATCGSAPTSSRNASSSPASSLSSSTSSSTSAAYCRVLWAPLPVPAVRHASVVSPRRGGGDDRRRRPRAARAWTALDDSPTRLRDGTTTSVEVVDALLERIASIDAPGTDVELRSILAVADDARDAATRGGRRACARGAERARRCTACPSW